MINSLKNIVIVLLLLMAAMSSVSCSTDTKNSVSTDTEISKSHDSFASSDNIKKLVLVTNKFCFNADFENALNMFNQRLSDLGKDYYVEFKIIDNLPADENEKEDGQTSYSKKYQDAVTKMRENGEQSDIITMANIDDSSDYSDYDYFYISEMILPLDNYIAKDTALKSAIRETEWNLAKRGKKTYIIPTSTVSAIGRGWEVDASSLKKLGITESDLQSEIWDILDNEKLSGKKIYADPAAENWQSGSGNPLPPYNAEWHYDLITPCVGVKFDDEMPTAVNIFEDEYMQNSIETAYELSDLEESDLCIYTATVTDSKVTKNDDSTYIPVDGKLYLTGDLCGLGIASWSENTEYAFDLISTLNTDRELALLLNYGLEGENYTLNADGSIAVSDSQFENYKNPYYIFSNRSALPSDSTVKFFNMDSAIISPICGFIFDSTNVYEEIKSTNQVLKKYRTLFKGEGNYESLNNKFSTELKNAGVQKIVDEANRQISNWQN